MYLDFEVAIPDLPGKIGRFKKGNTVYIRYVVGRKYHADRKYNIPNHKIIGKAVADDPSRMIPNENFLKYFGDTYLPELKRDASRSSCLRIGTFLVIRKIMEEYSLPQMLTKYLGVKDCGLFLDLCAYSIICENNAGQYYPMYAYNHPLLTEKMHIYSDTKVSDFFASITDDQSVGFLNEWNAVRDHREKIYISYDSTNKNCQAGDIEMVEFGHAKDPKDLPIFNYAVAYDTNNREPLFYEQYPGSIVDISQLQFMLEKAKGYGYKRVGFILDRGYFSKENIKYMDQCGYDFVIMVKGMASFVSGLILENKGKFENKRECSIRKYKTYGMTVRHQLYASDEEERYFHLYYSDQKASAQREQVEAKIDRMANHLDKLKGKAVTIGDGYRQYFELFIHEEDGVFLFAKEKAEVIERERDLCGYFVIVTSKKMSAKEALELYRSRDASEKLFSGDKSYLGNKNLRVQSDEAPAAEDGYQGAMTLARKISLGKYRGEYRICQRFAGLPDPFQYPEVTAEQIDLDPDGALDLTVVSEDGSWIALGNDLGEELILSCSDTEWTIDRSRAGKGDFSGKFCSDRTGMIRFPKKFADGRLRMIFDRSILEMEGDDGLTSATIDVYPNAPYTKVRMSGLKNCRIGTAR